MSQAEHAGFSPKVDAGAAEDGPAELGGGVMTQEVRRAGRRIAGVSTELSGQLAGSIAQLRALGEQVVQQMSGERLSDLAHGMVEILDRSLHECCCDLSWWAADDDVVAAPAQQGPGRRRAEARLATFLAGHPAYLDLWVADSRGRVVAAGRGGAYPGVSGADVAHEAWFVDALAGDGPLYAVRDVTLEPRLERAAVVTFATAIREGGDAQGHPLGVLAIHFDWRPRAEAVLANVRLGREEKARTRCLLLDGAGRIIAASEGGQVLAGALPLASLAESAGHYVDQSGCLVAYALSTGHEGYKGLGWRGVIIQAPSSG
jgi:hypothetical protein